MNEVKTSEVREPENSGVESGVPVLSTNEMNQIVGDAQESRTHSIIKRTMNPSSWCNPPPPGIEMDEESKHSNVSSAKSCSASVLDQIDPYIKNPEYVRYKKGISCERERATRQRRSRSRSLERCRSKSRSKSRERRRKYRSRSRSHGRGRERRSRSKGRRHRRYSHSSSRSRSRSSSLTRNRYKHKRKKSRRSRSRSRSHDRRRHDRKFNRSHSLAQQNEAFLADDDPNDNGDDEEVETKENAFKNDGSFLEMFKKMQEQKKAEAEKNAIATAPVASCSEVKKLLPVFGKRRGGRVLKTGMVEKTKAVEDDELANATDPWSIYLKEVKRYKEACCDDDSKTRPLVK